MIKRIGLAWLLCSSVSYASGIHVTDYSNIYQNTLTATESVKQTAQQLQQYQTQIQQLEDQVRNTLAPSVYLWDEVQQVQESAFAVANTLDRFKSEHGSLSNYLRKFRDLDFYRAAPCYGNPGCTPQDLENLKQGEVAGAAAQKQANDRVIKGLERQQQQIKADAARLQQLQNQAQQARGRMQALQAANQLASHQSAQLLQMRTMMVTQNAAQTARAQTVAAREARQFAAHEAVVKSEFKKSPPLDYYKYQRSLL